MKFTESFFQSLKNAKNIAIFTHKNSDHDTICSAVALKEILNQNGINVTIFVDKIPSVGILKFVQNEAFEISSEKIFDVGICVDCADIRMLNDENLKVFLRCVNTFEIDHHQDNSKFANFCYVKNSSSCCEVIYTLFKKYFKLDEYLATLLYTGMYMDCGSFNYTSANFKTLKCASELLKFCPSVNKNFFICFGIAGQENFEITKRAYNSVRFFEGGKIAVSVLRKSDFEEVGCKREEGKFIVTYLQNIKGVQIAISISEDKANEWRISLRTSSDEIDVSNVAHRFNGGGHKKASGLTLKGELDKALNALICECKKEMKK